MESIGGDVYLSDMNTHAWRYAFLWGTEELLFNSSVTRALSSPSLRTDSDRSTDAYASTYQTRGGENHTYQELEQCPCAGDVCNDEEKKAS